MLDRFQQSGGVHCYKVIKPIPRQVIKACLEQAAEAAEQKPTTTIRDAYSLQSSNQWLSCTLFFTKARPGFLTSGPERNITYCYALIAEIGKYLFVSKCGARNFSDLLEDYVQLVEPDVLMNAFIDKDSDVANFSAQTIGTKREGVHRQSFKGKRLQKYVSTFGAANKTLSNVQLEGKNGAKTVMGKAGRVNARGEKFDATGFITQGLSYIKDFKKPFVQNDFINSFAIPLKFPDYVSKITPTEILINTAVLSDFIISQPNPTPRLYYRKRNNRRYLTMTAGQLVEHLSGLEEVVKQGRGKQALYQLTSKVDKTLTVRANGTHYVLESDKFKHVYLEFDKTYSENVQQLINHNHLFNLTFSTPLIHYAEGKLWRNNNLLGNINGFLELFIADKALATITSEKGRPTTAAVKFPANTLFDFVESRFKSQVDYLVLDDLGYEVGDHVGIATGKKVQVIHSKAKQKGQLSASAFQEIVGQAQKNLNFFTQFDAINAKVASWKKTYASTKITRMRKGDKKKIGRDLTETLASTNADREVYLVVNFLSLSILQQELAKLKSGGKARRSVVPVLWLLSGLKTLCQEMHVKLYIYCKP